MRTLNYTPKTKPHRQATFKRHGFTHVVRQWNKDFERCDVAETMPIGNSTQYVGVFPNYLGFDNICAKYKADGWIEVEG